MTAEPASSSLAALGWRRRAGLGVLLAGLALAGNALHLPLFFGVDYLFGSIAVLLAVAWLGPLAAVAVAGIGGLYTLEMWGHPWALIIFVLEAGFVGLLRHRLGNLLLADLGFWLVLGAPLVLVFYLGVMAMDPSQAGLIALKQPLNGLFNALIANAILIGVQSRRQPVSFAELVFSLIFGGVFITGLALMAFQAHTVKGIQQEAVAGELQARLADLTTAAEGNASNPGDASILPKEGWPAPGTAHGLALMGEDGQMQHQRNLPSWFARAERQRLGEGLFVLLPPADRDLPTMVRWQAAHYALTGPLPEQSGAGRILVTEPAAPRVTRLSQAIVLGHAVLAAVALVATILALFIARALAHPFQRLQTRVQDLPQRIEQGQPAAIPHTAFLELEQLGAAFRAMAETLNGSFRQLKEERQGLEAAVQRRTKDLEQSRQALKQNYAELRRLAEVSAHHLQEPVRRSLIHAQRLRRNPERGDAEWQRLEGQLHWMSSLVTDLQRYLALQEHGPRVGDTPLGRILEQAREELPKGTPTLHVTTNPDPLPVVRADPALLTAALREILANAVRFRRADVPLEVRVSTRELPDHWEVAITDNGCGMDPAYTERVFRVFERLTPELAPEGTGIGLALVRRIVESHGGEVALESEGEGRGATVRFTLPSNGDDPG